MFIASLVLGILAIVFCWVPFLGLILAIAGGILSIVTLVKNKKTKDKKYPFAIVGVVLSGISFVVSIIFSIAVLGILNFAVNQNDVIDRAKEAIVESDKAQVEDSVIIFVTKYKIENSFQSPFLSDSKIITISGKDKTNNRPSDLLSWGDLEISIPESLKNKTVKYDTLSGNIIVE